MPLSGQLFAVGCTVCWAATALLFTYAGRRVGSLPVNIFRLSWALVFFAAYAAWRQGNPLPATANGHQWSWMALSGIVGFFLGDLFLFRAMVEIGTRLSMLLMSLAPAVAALVAWLWLGEALTAPKLLGMAVTLGGVALVILERPEPALRAGAGSLKPAAEHAAARKSRAGGMVCAVLGAVGQGVGAVLAKIGMAPSYAELPAMLSGAVAPLAAFEATYIRALTALLGFLLLSSVLRRNGRLWTARADRRAMLAIFVGAFFGPFIGAAMFNLSLQHVAAGVTQTIVATLPVVILPFNVWIERETVTPRAIAGALITVGGVALLCW